MAKKKVNQLRQRVRELVKESCDDAELVVCELYNVAVEKRDEAAKSGTNRAEEAYWQRVLSILSDASYFIDKETE